MNLHRDAEKHHFRKAIFKLEWFGYDISKLTDMQKQALRFSYFNKQALIHSPRRQGKSYLAVIYALAQMKRTKCNTLFIVRNNSIIKHVNRIFYACSNSFDHITFTNSGKTITINNGSVCNIITKNDLDYFRGTKYSNLIIDDADVIDELDDIISTMFFPKIRILITITDKATNIMNSNIINNLQYFRYRVKK